DFATTTVYYRGPEDQEAARGLADAIGGAEIAQSDFLQPTDDPNTSGDESAEKRLVVVIGLDRASAQPTP
ncbi:LytR C-terminal domain-containing protein, partial [Shewanella algae]